MSSDLVVCLVNACHSHEVLSVCSHMWGYSGRVVVGKPLCVFVGIAVAEM